MTITHMTPKDFAPHLLAVLAELTEYNANVSLPMTETYKPVCVRMGLKEDHGGHTDGGHVFTHRQIGLAFRQHIRGKGLGEQVKKGQWMLTQAGIDKARGEDTGDTEPLLAAKANATAETETETVTETETETVKEEAEVLHLPVVTRTPKHPYSDDPYIRSLAIEAVRCYGAWASRSDVCKGCPLATDCMLQVGARKAEMAAKLEAAESAAVDKAQSKAKEDARKGQSVSELISTFDDEEEGSSTPRDLKKGKFKPSDGQDFAKANASRESMCLQCGDAINKGDPVQWCANEGIFHVECFDDHDQ